MICSSPACLKEEKKASDANQQMMGVIVVNRLNKL